VTTTAGWVLLLPITGLAVLWWWLTPSRPTHACRAPGCGASRYAPMDEHFINAHHRYDTRRTDR
jgi:hypothetical protein